MRVFSNTAVSIDGRIAPVDRSHVQLGSARDRERMSELRATADAVLVGGNTFRNWPRPCVEDEAQVDGRREGPIINAILTRQGIDDGDLHAWPDTRARMIVYTGPSAFVPDQVEVVRHPSPSPSSALDHLATLGCRSVLVEAGGDLIFTLLRDGRLDELYVTLCPRVVGGLGAPTLADGAGFSARSIQPLVLVSADAEGDEVFLHYRVHR
jgi:5-amino-6-(5-phosphoribosylamino)uracil reductase